MYIISVIFKSCQHVAQFHFEQSEDAASVLSQDRSESFFIEDDYGSIGHFNPGEIASIILTDLDRELEAQNKCNLARAQAQARLQKQINQDPANRLLTPQPFNAGNA